ncbi:MAG: MerR family transcriptional regulator, partial [Chloroflexota bacterium]|nr:MerR family transcriptional regulator [Chloroflexota bacterium]
YYERQGLLAPSRSQGKTRFYSPRDIERLRRIRTLTSDLGVNLAGVEVAMRLMERIVELEHQAQDMATELARLRGPEAEGSATDIEEANK